MHNAAMALKKYWIPGLWALWLPLYLWSGAAPDRYAMDVLQAQPSYPTRGILECMALTAIESGVLYAIIRPGTYHHSWKRPVAALLLFLPALVVAAVLLIHQPAFILVHFLWLLLVNLILVGLTAFALLGSRFASARC
jgi:hypothetical protein